MTTVLKKSVIPQRTGNRPFAGPALSAEPVTSTDGGQSLIIASFQQIAWVTPRIDNQGTDGVGAGAQDVNWELHVSNEQTVESGDRSWTLFDDGSVASGEIGPSIPIDTGNHSVKLTVTSAASGVHSEGLRLSMGVAV